MNFPFRGASLCGVHRAQVDHVLFFFLVQNELKSTVILRYYVLGTKFDYSYESWIVSMLFGGAVACECQWGEKLCSSSTGSRSLVGLAPG